MSDNFISEEDFWKDALSYTVKTDDVKVYKKDSTPDTKTDEPEPIEIDLGKLPRSIDPAFNNKLFVTRNGIYLDVTGVDTAAVRALCNKFMVKSRSSFGNKWNIARAFNVIKRAIPPTVQGAKHTQQILLLLPRFGFLEFYFTTLLGEQIRLQEGKRKTEYADMTFLRKFRLSGIMNVVNQLQTFAPDPTITSVELKLAEHQTKVINYMMVHHFNQQAREFGFAGINLKLKTGAGKSYIAFGLIDYLKLPTLLVVHNQPQAEDMYQLAKKYFPNTSVGIYHSSAKKLGKIMVIVVHSACGADEYNFVDPDTKIKKTYSVQEFFSLFGLGIFDESHKYCSPEFSKVFARCQFSIMMGLSATPGERQDGFDPITYMNAGPLVDIQEKIPGLLKDDPFTSQIVGIKYLGPAEYTAYKANEHGMFDNNATLIQMMDDPYRLEMIVNILEFLSVHKRHVYIFSDRLEYLSIIRRALFKRMRQSGKVLIKDIENLDEEVIEFMKGQPNYENYCKELTTSVNTKLTNEFKRVQEDLNRNATVEFYNEARVRLQNGDIANNAWYRSALTSVNHQAYVPTLMQAAQSHVQKLQDNYNEILKAEGERDYYEQLLETYKKNYIDDYIETKSTLSVLTGGAKGDQINISSERATMIFTTYGYMGTGKSIPKMDTILFVTPRRNGVEQVIGRVFRPGPNKNTRWILDTIDWKINLKSQWYERLKVYERQTAQNRNPTISETEINYTDIVPDSNCEDKKIKDTFAKILTSTQPPSMPPPMPPSGFICDFAALGLEPYSKGLEPSKTKTPSAKKVRIIKKF